MLLYSSTSLPATNPYTFNPATPVGANTLNIPDVGGTDTFAFTTLAQTLNNKTLTSATLGSNLAGGGFLIQNLSIPPINTTDSAAKGYLNYPVVVVSTTALSGTYSSGTKTITATSNVAFPAVDGVTLNTIGQRILVNGQSTASNNGIYKLTTVGSGSTPWVLTRDVDFNTTALINVPAFVFVGQGTSYAGSYWYYSNVSATLDTTSTTFTEGGSMISLPLSLSNGGTGQSNTAAAGAVAYSTASAIALNTPQGSTAGVPLVSGTSGTGAPTFSALNLASSSAITGLLPLANGGTNANLTASNGAIPYSSASAIALLAAGTTNQLIQSNGAAAPSWTYGINGTSSISGTATLTNTSGYLIVITGGTYTITLPSAGSNIGLAYCFKYASGSGTVTIARAGSDTIDGATSVTLNTVGQSIIIQSTAANTWTVTDPLPAAGTGLSQSFSGGIQTLSLSTPVSLANGGTNASLTAVAGAGIYSSGTALVLTAAGSSGNVFVSAGTTASWTTLNLASSAAVGTSILPIANGGTNSSTAAGGLSNLGGQPLHQSILTKSANYTTTTLDQIIQVTTGASNIVITTVTPGSGNKGIIYTVNKADSNTSGYVTITPASGTINGASTAVVDVQYDSLSYYNDGVNFWSI